MLMLYIHTLQVQVVIGDTVRALPLLQPTHMVVRAHVPVHTACVLLGSMFVHASAVVTVCMFHNLGRSAHVVIEPYDTVRMHTYDVDVRHCGACACACACACLLLVHSPLQ